MAAESASAAVDKVIAETERYERFFLTLRAEMLATDLDAHPCIARRLQARSRMMPERARALPDHPLQRHRACLERHQEQRTR
jgi:hypothetical protein